MDKLIERKEADKLKSMLKESRQVVLTGHVRPDGDAVGSTLALQHLLKKMGKEAWVILPDKPPVNLSFLPGFKEIATYTSHKEYCEECVNKADLIICCDFNTPSRLDNMSDLIIDSQAKKILIDHHMEPSAFTDLTLSYPDMSSTCELVFRLIAAMGWFGEVDTACATSLLTGMITDTRNFSVNIKNPDIYEILSRILSLGINKERIVKEALNTRSYNSLKLEAFALSERLEVFNNHKGALITLNKDDLVRFNYERGDTEGLVNRPLEIRGLVYSIFMREDSDCIKVSARSCENFPVSEICKDLFNGGGHLQAAGGEFYGSLEDCRKKLIEAMPNYDKYLKKNSKKSVKVEN